MIIYRMANADDSVSIARLQAESWRHRYRGIFRDEYLDGPVFKDRRRLWVARLDDPPAHQYTVVAESEGRMCGFACVFADHDPRWGAFLDNLHVLPEWQGRGIGRDLMRAVAEWVKGRNPRSCLYLWVLKDNLGAIRFYECMGGVCFEQSSFENPGGGYADVLRYVWEDPGALLTGREAGESG